MNLCKGFCQHTQLNFVCVACFIQTCRPKEFHRVRCSSDPQPDSSSFSLLLSQFTESSCTSRGGVITDVAVKPVSYYSVTACLWTQSKFGETNSDVCCMSCTQLCEDFLSSQKGYGTLLYSEICSHKDAQSFQKLAFSSGLADQLCPEKKPTVELIRSGIGTESLLIQF